MVYRDSHKPPPIHSKRSCHFRSFAHYHRDLHSRTQRNEPWSLRSNRQNRMSQSTKHSADYIFIVSHSTVPAIEKKNERWGTQYRKGITCGVSMCGCKTEVQWVRRSPCLCVSGNYIYHKEAFRKRTQGDEMSSLLLASLRSALSLSLFAILENVGDVTNSSRPAYSKVLDMHAAKRWVDTKSTLLVCVNLC